MSMEVREKNDNNVDLNNNKNKNNNNNFRDLLNFQWMNLKLHLLPLLMQETDNFIENFISKQLIFFIYFSLKLNLYLFIYFFYAPMG